MNKNVASQKLTVFAFDSTTNLPKTGDAANITAYVSIDSGAVTVLADTSATEKDATNAKGYYLFDVAQAETNGDKLEFTAKSSTANVVVIGVPPVIYTDPPNASALSIDTGGVVKSNLVQILATALTESVGGYLAAAFKKLFDVAAPAFTAASVNQGGDAYSLIGANGAGLTAIGDTRLAHLDADISTRSTYAGADTGGTTALLARLTSARAGYLDNLNIGGVVASHADVAAINTSSSKHLTLTTVGQYERPESASTLYTVECRTYAAADGSVVNADSTPTLTVFGQTSGSLAANLGTATNPAAGLYRWVYTVQSSATTEQIRFDVSATIASATFTLSAYSQVLDEVAQTWTSTDRSMLTAAYNKLPANNIADETIVLSAIGTPMQAGNVTLAASQPNYAPAKAGDAMALTTGERSTLAASVWNALTSGIVTTGSIGKRLLDFVTSLVYTAPLDAAGTRGAVGMAAANLDTQLTAILSASGGGTGGNPTVAGFTDAALLAMRQNLNGVVVTILGPVLKLGGVLTVIVTQGDDYAAADGRQITIDLDGTVLPDLTGATVQLRLSSGAKALTTGTVVVATGTTRTVQFTPSAAETGPLSPSPQGVFAVKITTAAGRIITPNEARGTLIVLPRIVA